MARAVAIGLALSVVAGISLPHPVQAQGTPATGGLTGQETAGGELGMPIGSFRLFPQLDLVGGYDTNVFAQPAGQQVPSAYTAIRPTLDLRSDWNNHMLNFGANGAFGFYTNAPTQNYQNFSVYTNGRLDIQQDWTLTGSASYNRSTEALGTPDVAFAQTPTVVNFVPVNLALYQRFNRFFYRLSGDATPFWYQDGGTLASNVLPASSRNRTEYNEGLRAGYEVTEGFDVWAQGSVNQRRYTETINIVNQQRDSNGWTVTGGATLDLGGISRLEGYAGFTAQNYLQTFTTTNAMVFGLAGVWNGYAPLILRPSITRSINETAFTQFNNFVSTNLGFEFVYSIQSEWQLQGGALYSLAQYSAFTGAGSAPGRNDNYYRGTLTLFYSLRPQIQIGPQYEYYGASSSDSTGPSYNRHVISLRLIAKR